MATIRSRNWFITLNTENTTKNQNLENVELYDYKKIFSFFQKNFDNFTFQLERGENGNKHYQGYINTKNAMTFDRIKNLFNRNGYFPHIEKCKKTIAAIKYCSKDETRLAGPWNQNTIINVQNNYKNEDIEPNDNIKNQTIAECLAEFDIYHYRKEEKLNEKDAIAAAARNIYVTETEGLTKEDIEDILKRMKKYLCDKYLKCN